MSNRQERANSEIQKCLIEIIQHKMNDPRLDKVITVTDVNVSPDFRYCKVKISVLDINDIKNVTQVLQKSEGYIKKELAGMIDLPFMPPGTRLMPCITTASGSLKAISLRLSLFLKVITLAASAT